MCMESVMLCCVSFGLEHDVEGKLKLTLSCRSVSEAESMSQCLRRNCICTKITIVCTFDSQELSSGCNDGFVSSSLLQIQVHYIAS
jgi:hypothetical protein